MSDTPSATMQKPRKCANCDGGIMHCTDIKDTGFGADISYQCASCDAQVTLPPEGYISSFLVVWALVSGGLYWLLIASSPYPDGMSYAIVAGMTLLGGYFAIRGLLVHLGLPFVDADADAAKPKPHALPTPSPMAKFWTLGFFKTPLLAFTAAVVILGLSALLGSFLDTL